MYYSKKSPNKTQYSAFCSDFHALNEKNQDFGRFQNDREDFSYNDKISRLKKFNESYKGSAKKMPESF
jgi:hypothetical protein